MNLSKFKFHAFTNTGFEPVLKKELSNIVKNPVVKNIFGKTGVEFRGTFPEMIDIILQSRIINSLRIVIGHPFHGSDVSNIKFNLERLNFAAFLPENAVLNDYVRYHTNSIGSNLYHESMIKDIVKSKLEDLFDSKLKLQEFSHELDQRLLMGSIDEPSIQIADKNLNVVENSKTQPKSRPNKKYNKYKKKFEDEMFDLYFNLYNDKMCVSLEVFNTALVKTGYKKFIGWGSVKENIISAYLQQSGIIDDFKKEESIKLLDPFCGSGTILIESILSTIDYPIRYDHTGQINFNNWPILTKDENIKSNLDEYIKNKKNDYNKEIKVSCIGFDISKNQLDNAINNFKHLDELDVIKNLRLNDNKIIISLKNSMRDLGKKTRSFKNKILLTNGSFKTLSEQVDKLDGYTLITNIPYGSNYSEEKLNELYSAFDTFLVENHQYFKKIVILCPNNRKNSYIMKSKYQWNIELDFYNGGYKMGFFSFTPAKNTLKDENLEPIVHERVIKRKRRSDKVVKSKIILNKKQNINSKKMKENIDFAKKKKLNQHLKHKKEYEAKKSERIKAKIEFLDQKKALMMEKKLKELMGDKDSENINKLIKSK